MAVMGIEMSPAEEYCDSSNIRIYVQLFFCIANSGVGFVDTGNKKLSYVASRHHFCKRKQVCEGVWECFEHRQCKYVYDYGGDRFCRHPSCVNNNGLSIGTRLLAAKNERGSFSAALNQLSDPPLP